MDGSVDLRAYAALGDGRTVALVADDGRIDWFPLPMLDSAPAFAALLDAQGGGVCALQPEGDYRLTREYRQGTNVLVTTYTTADGSAVVTESLNSGVAGRLPWTELARRVEGHDGSVRMTWAVAPGHLLGTVAPWLDDTAHGPALRAGLVSMAVRGIDHGPDAEPDGGARLSGAFRTTPGSRHLVAVVGTYDQPLNMPVPEEIDDRIDRTVKSWQTWADAFAYAGPWAAPVLRSALALKLLIHSPTGAIAAAATTSLPESRAGGKNWDYRYAWIRDTAFTINALIRLGLREEIHAAVAWMLDSVRRHGPHVFTTLSGDLPEGRELAPAPGWRGIGPVVNGNDASDQLQLGLFGDLFDVVTLYVDAGHSLDPSTARMLADLADLCCDQWRAEDAGMWELPELAHYTASKMGCWQALHCAVHLVELGELTDRNGRWRLERDLLRVFIDERCWSAQVGAYTRHPDTTDLDAAVLLFAADFDRGPRMSSTIDAISAKLGDGPLLYRYTGMDAEEGTFLACAFWRVSALAHVGRRDEAVPLMEQLVALANEVGLYAEMIDATDGSFLGNLPQGLSHLALITAALTLAETAEQ